MVLARVHPVDVSGHGVDLAVVAEHAEGLGALPGWSGVGGEALVEDAKRDLQLRIGEVRIEAGQLIGRAERLVGHGAEGERGYVQARLLALDALAGAKRCELDLVVAEPFGRGELRLHDRWLRSLSPLAQVRGIDRHLAPAREADFLRCASLLDEREIAFLAREDHCQAAFRSQARRERQEDAGAVAGEAVGVDRAAVLDAAQRGENQIEDAARRLTVHVGDEADTAGVPFSRRIVQLVQRPHCHVWFPSLHDTYLSSPGCDQLGLSPLIYLLVGAETKDAG